MPSKGSYTVDRVPLVLLCEAWPHVAPWLARGAAGAQQDERQLVARILRSECDLWMITDREKCVGAFVTERIQFEQHKNPTLHMFALAGTGLRQWAQPVHDTLIRFARAVGCRSVRFYGRDAYRRLYPDCVVSAGKPGFPLYERAV